MKKLFQISLFVVIMLLLAYTPAKQDSLSKSIQLDTLHLSDSLDLKFKNNSGYDIKLYASTTNTRVTVKVMKIDNT